MSHDDSTQTPDAPYEAPELTVIGSLAGLTLGSDDGTQDGMFGGGTDGSTIGLS